MGDLMLYTTAGFQPLKSLGNTSQRVGLVLKGNNQAERTETGREGWDWGERLWNDTSRSAFLGHPTVLALGVYYHHPPLPHPDKALITEDAGTLT